MRPGKCRIEASKCYIVLADYDQPKPGELVHIHVSERRLAISQDPLRSLPSGNAFEQLNLGAALANHLEGDFLACCPVHSPEVTELPNIYRMHAGEESASYAQRWM